MSEWKPIESAPKEIIQRHRYSEKLTHEYGVDILACPVFGKMAVVRWYQSDNNPKAGNFINDGNCAVRPTHWRPLPPKPE